jgi:hypothetical protein
MYDLTGKIVFRETFDLPAGRGQHLLCLPGSLEKQMYILRILDPANLEDYRRVRVVKIR